MTLKFRGNPYQLSQNIQFNPKGYVNGQYRGIATQISIPREKSFVDIVNQMTYRGIKYFIQ